MPAFSYKARDDRGALLTGVLEAPSRDHVIAQLRAERRIVVEVVEGAISATVEASRVRQAARTVKQDEVIGFCSQLAVMLETGVPLAEALDSYLANCRGGSLRHIVNVVSQHVQGGASLSAAMAPFPKAFPSLIISLVRAAEASGSLALMLTRVSEYLAKERRTRQQIQGALAYPIVMVVMAVVVTLFLVVWVLPRFARIYASREAALPVPTQIVMSISDVLITHWPLMLGGVAASAFAFLIAYGTPKGRTTIDWIAVRAPLVGRLVSMHNLTRSTRTLATLLAAGVTLVDGVRIVKGLCRNTVWSGFWDRVHGSITGGLTMGEVATTAGIMPPTVASMIAAAERTGRLPQTLDRVAEVSEKDLDEAIKSVTQMIEPAMITVMGTVIGGIVVALLLPIFSLSSVMSS